VDPDTRFWLERHQIKYNHLLYDDHKYLRLAELVDSERVMGVVEDLSDMMDEAETVFKPWSLFLVDRPHNTFDLRGKWSFLNIQRTLVKGLHRGPRFLL
jgi:hypothetical protein